jgi:thiol-disulfide isomerase/thioredoxin
MVRALLLAVLPALLAAQGGPKLPLGAAMPPFALPGVDGRVLDSKSLKGPVVVVFLSTQCPYVLASEDRINALARAYAGRVAFVGINSNESESETRRDEGMEGMKAHAARKGYAFPYLKDDSQAVIKAYGGVCTPDFFLFDANGKLVYRGRMDDNTTPRKEAPVTRQDLKEALDAVLAGRPVDPDQKPSRGCSIKWKA